MNVLINTARGQKTPRECIDLFLTGNLDNGALVGIFKQLAEKARAEAKELAALIISKETYSEKLRRLATEMLSGTEKPKHVRNAHDIIDVMSGLGKGSYVSMTLRRFVPKGIQATSFARGILGMHNAGLVSLDEAEGLSILIRARAWRLVFAEKYVEFTVKQELTEELLKPFAEHLSKCVEVIDVKRKVPC